MKNKLMGAILACVLMAVSSIAADNMYKVGELYTKKAELKGKIVTVKGKVIKISRGIMGKDWVHVQDDSLIKKESEVIFTAAMDSSKVVVGQMVTAKGTVKTDVDLGAGYFYSVLVEDSTFAK